MGQESLEKLEQGLAKVTDAIIGLEGRMNQRFEGLEGKMVQQLDNLEAAEERTNQKPDKTEQILSILIEERTVFEGKIGLKLKEEIKNIWEDSGMNEKIEDNLCEDSRMNEEIEDKTNLKCKEEVRGICEEDLIIHEEKFQVEDPNVEEKEEIKVSMMGKHWSQNNRERGGKKGKEHNKNLGKKKIKKKAETGKDKNRERRDKKKKVRNKKGNERKWTVACEGAWRRSRKSARTCVLKKRRRKRKRILDVHVEDGMSPAFGLNGDTANMCGKWRVKMTRQGGVPRKTAAAVINVVVGCEKLESMSKKKLGFMGIKIGKERKGDNSKVVQEDADAWAVLGVAGKRRVNAGEVTSKREIREGQREQREKFTKPPKNLYSWLENSGQWGQQHHPKTALQSMMKSNSAPNHRIF